MNFYEWMMKTHLNKNSRQGDLAGDMEFDTTFPCDGDRTTILHYLYSEGACPDCIDTFKDCWKGYLRHERKFD